MITSLIGCGILSAEGHVHKRQRRVATPAFSIQSMRELVPVVFRKGIQLQNKWNSMIPALVPDRASASDVTLDVCAWVSRATFDVIGLAGIVARSNILLVIVD